MLKPDELLHISEGAEEIAEKLHNDIIKRIVDRIMLRIGRGEDYLLTATDKWNIENLQQAGYLLEDIQKDIAKATKLQQTEIAEAMEDAGVKALDYDDKIYQSVGLSPTPLTQSPELIRLMQRNYEATLGEWANFTRTTANEAQKLFISQLDRAYNLVSTGALSYTAAVKEVLNNIVSDGVITTYPTGHSDTIETATLRAVRTGISQATAQIQLARMEEMDCDKVIISSHLGARPSHQVWQGKVFTVEELYNTNDGMPAYGTVGGLCGANCRHNFSPWFDGMDNPFEHYDSEENLKQYEKEQRQRTLERRIRKTKREVMGLKESIDVCKDDKLKFELDLDYQRKSALLAKQNKVYADYCAENGLRPLSDRIQIAKWDRQQAAAARGAAKRYENAHGGSQKTKIISIENANAIATNAIKEAYEYKVNVRGANLIPYDELDELGKATLKADFSGMDKNLAMATAEQFDNLTKEYDTVCEKIIVGSLDASTAPAGTKYYYNSQSAEIILNKSIVKDKNGFYERMEKAIERGQFPKITKGKYDKYVITHEFAHTLMDFGSPLSNYINVDVSNIRKARKEIVKIHENYFDEWRSLEIEYRKAEKKAIETFDDLVWKEAQKAEERLNEMKISKYADYSIEEFFAEAFADAKLGSNPSKYSIEVLKVIDKYFKKK